MENLSLEDAPPAGSGQQQQQQFQQGPPGPPPVPQLPPQMFTTAAQLLDLTDKKLLVVLRDGRKLVGVLRSWDQFANLVMQDTVEQVYAEGAKAVSHVPRGLFLVRGENVLLLGEIDLDKDDQLPEPYKEEDGKKVDKMHKQEAEERKRKEKQARSKLQAYGFEGELGDAMF